MKSSTTHKITLSAMFFSLCIVLPFLTGQIPSIGSMLLPMHLPVLLCSYICGWKYGAVVGFFAPIIRSLIFSMPPLFPDAVSMAFELTTYGLLAGFIYALFKNRNISTVYLSLIASMIAGRIVWGVVQFILLSSTGNLFTFGIFFTRAFANAIPGIIVQLVVIPSVIAVVDKLNIVLFKNKIN